jgi:uncharacterized protein YgiM (DUF1202 family)
VIKALGRAKLAGSFLVATSLLFGLGGAALAYQAEAATAYTATAAVNVRTGPGTSHAIVAVLARGQVVTGAGTAANGWQPVVYGAATRYVSATYLKVADTSTTAPSVTPSASAGPAKVATANVNIRSGPSLDDPIVSVLTKGTQISTTGATSGDFSQVTFQDELRWVYSLYLADVATPDAATPDPTAPAPTPSAGTTAARFSATTTAVLALRETPSITATSAGNLPTGSMVQLTGEHSASYSQILRQGVLRWVLSGYLRPVATELLPAAPTLPTSVGKRYTTIEGLNIRTGSSSSTTSVATVAKGIVLLITGVTQNGYSQVIYNGAARWAASMYLSTTRPGSTAYVGVVGSLGSASLDRTNTNAKGIVLAIREKFPQVKTIYGWRMYSAYSSDHPNGRALDIMIPSWSTASGRALGDAIAAYLQQNREKHRVHYLIWRQRNWNVERSTSPTAWRSMSDRGGATANHYDHVHVSVYDR